MRLLCCLALGVLLACGSNSASTGDPKSNPPPTAKPPAPPQPVAVAFVFQGWEMWVGNDDIVPEEDPGRQLGVLKELEKGFERVPLKNLPPGSKGAVVSYGDRATVRQPMGPIASLTAASFGAQKDYAGVIDRNLVGGVTLGLDELAKVPDARRVLIVIGDGTDRNPEVAKVELAKLAKRAAAEKVEIVSIVYKAYLSSPGNQISVLDPNLVSVNSIDGILDQLGISFDLIAHPPVAAPPGPPPTFTLALLMADQEVWAGNDNIVPADEPDHYLGALKAIRAAFEKAPMTGFPAGSQAMVITYDQRAQIKAPLMPIENLGAREIGTQKDTYRKVGTELVAGVRLAISELAKVTSGRRVLVILGDGNDTNNEAAKGQLRQLAKLAADQKVEVYALIYKGPLSIEGSVITELDPKATTSATTDQLTADLVALFRVLRNR